MQITQISIFLENKSGRLAEVIVILKKANIKILALSLADTTDFGILRMIVNNNEKAEHTLKKEGFTVGKTNVLGIEIKDFSKSLDKILAPLAEFNVNVEYVYSFLNPKVKNPVMIFRFDNIDKAISILEKQSIKIIKKQDL